MHPDPLVSIILPYRNAAPYIFKAIKSVLEQDHPHWELLLVDNGCDDMSNEFVEAFDWHPCVHRLYASEVGVSNARNVGLEAASGKYICFLDADDRMPKSGISSRVWALEENPDADFCDGTVHFYDARFKRKLRTWRPSYSGKPLDELVKLTGSCFMGISWMCRRTRIGDIRFPEGQTHSEDLSFYLRLASEGGDYIFVDEPVYEVRVRPDSAMSSLAGLEMGYAAVASQLPDLGISKELREVFQKRVRRILFRSYLKRFQPREARRVFKEWSQSR